MPDKKNGISTNSPTERLIYSVLQDGCPHGLRELFGCLSAPPPDNGSRLDLKTARSALNFHLSNLRKKLPAGQVIDCVLIHHRVNYQIRRKLYPAE